MHGQKAIALLAAWIWLLAGNLSLSGCRQVAAAAGNRQQQAERSCRKSSFQPALPRPPADGGVFSKRPAARPPVFSGSSALEFTRKAVSFGPRPAGSAALDRLRAYILSRLKLYRCEVVRDSFRAETPLGAVPMENIIARFAGSSGRIIAVTGHYETKSIPGVHFVGANDGGASTGFLLELARVLSSRARKDEIRLVWFDGEESIGQWSETDGLYGSRHLAARWAADGTLARLKALINVDMIGDKDLGIIPELNSSESLRRIVWATAAELGFSRHFLNEPGAIEDDHVPFARRGVNAIDLIDFEYGPANSYWHTASDTMDKLSAASLEVVGKVVLAVINKLEQDPVR